MVAVPLGLACAVFALWLSGTSLNVYSQIGLIILIGVAAKKIQSALGDFNDTRINRTRLAQIASAGTLGGPDMFVLGRIDARLEADGHRAIAAYRRVAKEL